MLLNSVSSTEVKWRGNVIDLFMFKFVAW